VKTFTLEEAQAVLPVVESLLKRAMEAQRSAAVIEQELQQLSQRIFLTGGMHVDIPTVNRQRAAHDLYVGQTQELVTEIDSIGVEVKDLNSGLLDFPCRLDDEVVLLCWKQGEERITHWHTMEAGFRGRQPIDERFRRTKPN
jgi:hypothetical protein